MHISFGGKSGGRIAFFCASTPQAAKKCYSLAASCQSLKFQEKETAMFKKLMNTSGDFVVTLLRLALGVVFFAHGAQKVLGWFGGFGFQATLGFFTQQMHIPAVLAVLAMAAELLGGIGLLIGFLSRVAAFGIACNMVVAVALIHRHFGLFANWYGTQKGEGYEFHIFAITLCLAIMIKGSGALSIDRSASRQSA
jgi:putative oxidoreductase